MKRSIIVVLTLIFALMLGMISVSAEAPTYELITEDSQWLSLPHDNAICTVEWVNGNAVFSGSTAGNWPSVTTKYGAANAITVNIEDYSLVYDFTVEGGNTNISFIFSEADHTFPLSNSSIGSPDVDPGSGDLLPAVYSGKVSLTDFVNSTSFLDNQLFDIALISDNNELTFHGVQVFSVGGGVITIRELKLVPNEGVGDKNDETESKSEESKDPESKTESVDENVDESESADEGNDNVGMTVVIVLSCVAGVAVLAAIIVAVIVIVKKKK